jgi:hypothetical protein
MYAAKHAGGNTVVSAPPTDAAPEGPPLRVVTESPRARPISTRRRA